MISVLARQLERLRDHIPIFAQQWQCVEAFMDLTHDRVAQKAKQVEEVEAEMAARQQLHAQQYDLLQERLQRQVEEARAAWQLRRRHVESCKQQEYELHQAVVAQEQQSKALKSTLDKTWRQMEEMQQTVSQARATLEARANGDWTHDLPSKSREMADQLQRHMELREEVLRAQREVEQACLVLGQQRAQSARLEDFTRRISGGGGRYVLPLPLKREAQRLLKAAGQQRDAFAAATRDSGMVLA